jgi:uncharacterized repeat protein (TIGR03803 family)
MENWERPHRLGLMVAIPKLLYADFWGQPYAALIAAQGALYGTTSGGVVYGRGTVFKLTP